MELAPLQERSVSGAINKNGGAGAESERVFFIKIGAGAERSVNKMELEWSRSGFFCLISTILPLSLHCSVNNDRKINQRKGHNRLFIAFNMLLPHFN